jgi:hypothetical protein
MGLKGDCEIEIGICSVGARAHSPNMKQMKFSVKVVRHIGLWKKLWKKQGRSEVLTVVNFYCLLLLPAASVSPHHESCFGSPRPFSAQDAETRTGHPHE